MELFAKKYQNRVPRNPTRKSPKPKNPKPEIPDPRYIGYRALQNPPKPDRVFLFRAPTRPDPQNAHPYYGLHFKPRVNYKFGPYGLILITMKVPEP